MQIIKGVAIAAVLIIAGLLALIVAAYLAFRIAAAIFEQQESWKDSGSRKGRKRSTSYKVVGWGLAGSNRADTEYRLRRAAVLHRYCYVEYVTFWGYVEFDKRGQREPDRTL